jgi:hypothetical protein
MTGIHKQNNLFIPFAYDAHDFGDFLFRRLFRSLVVITEQCLTAQRLKCIKLILPGFFVEDLVPFAGIVYHKGAPEEFVPVG